MRRTHSFWWGVLLVLLGVALLAGNLGMADIRHAISTYWPVLLILWGISVLFRRSARPPGAHTTTQGHAVFGDAEERTASELLDYSNVFGDINIQVTSQSFKGGKASTVFGDTRVDISGGGLADGEQTLHLSGVFGDAEVIVPRGAAVSVSASTVFGDVRVREQVRKGFTPSVTLETPEYAQATRRLRISASQIFGDVTVRE